MNKEIKQELEQLEAYALLSNKKENRNPFQTPAGYFIEKKSSLLSIAKDENAYTVPNNYFENLTDQVMDKVDELEEKRISINPKRKQRSFTIIWAAASMLLLFSVFVFLNKSDANFTAENNEALFQDVDDFELAFLYDNTESYVLNSLYEDTDTFEEEDILDPLFDGVYNLEDIEDII